MLKQRSQFGTKTQTVSTSPAPATTNRQSLAPTSHEGKKLKPALQQVGHVVFRRASSVTQKMPIYINAEQSDSDHLDIDFSLQPFVDPEGGVLIVDEIELLHPGKSLRLFTSKGDLVILCQRLNLAAKACENKLHFRHCQQATLSIEKEFINLALFCCVNLNFDSKFCPKLSLSESIIAENEFSARLHSLKVEEQARLFASVLRLKIIIRAEIYGLVYAFEDLSVTDGNLHTSGHHSTMTMVIGAAGQVIGQRLLSIRLKRGEVDLQGLLTAGLALKVQTRHKFNIDVNAEVDSGQFCFLSSDSRMSNLGKVTAGQSLLLAAQHFQDSISSLHRARKLYLGASASDQHGLYISREQQLHDVGQQHLCQSSRLLSGNEVLLDSPQAHHEGQSISAGLTAMLADSLDHSGQMLANTLVLNIKSLFNQTDANISATQSLHIIANYLQNCGNLAARELILQDVATLWNSETGTISASHRLACLAASIIRNAGKMHADDELLLQATQYLDNLINAQITGGDDVVIRAAKADNAGKIVAAKGTLSFEQFFLLQNFATGCIEAHEMLQLNGGDMLQQGTILCRRGSWFLNNLSNSGVVDVEENLSINVHKQLLLLREGRITVRQALTILAKERFHCHGDIQAVGLLTIAAAHCFITENAEVQSTANDLLLQVTDLILAGHLYSANELTLKIANWFEPLDGASYQGKETLRLDLAEGHAFVRPLHAVKHLIVTTPKGKRLQNFSHVSAAGDLAVSGAALSNGTCEQSATLESAQNLSLDLASLDNHGMIRGELSTEVQCEQLLVNGELVKNGDHFSRASATIASGGSLKLGSLHASIRNAGHVLAASDAIFDAPMGVIHNQAGLIEVKGNLSTFARKLVQEVISRVRRQGGVTSQRVVSDRAEMKVAGNVNFHNDVDLVGCDLDVSGKISQHIGGIIAKVVEEYDQWIETHFSKETRRTVFGIKKSPKYHFYDIVRHVTLSVYSASVNAGQGLEGFDPGAHYHFLGGNIREMMHLQFAALTFGHVPNQAEMSKAMRKLFVFDVDGDIQLVGSDVLLKGAVKATGKLLAEVDAFEVQQQLKREYHQYRVGRKGNVNTQQAVDTADETSGQLEAAEVFIDATKDYRQRGGAVRSQHGNNKIHAGHLAVEALRGSRVNDHHRSSMAPEFFPAVLEAVEASLELNSDSYLELAGVKLKAAKVVRLHARDGVSIKALVDYYNAVLNDQKSLTSRHLHTAVLPVVLGNSIEAGESIEVKSETQDINAENTDFIVAAFSQLDELQGLLSFDAPQGNVSITAVTPQEYHMIKRSGFAGLSFVRQNQQIRHVQVHPSRMLIVGNLSINARDKATLEAVQGVVSGDADINAREIWMKGKREETEVSTETTSVGVDFFGSQAISSLLQNKSGKQALNKLLCEDPFVESLFQLANAPKGSPTFYAALDTFIAGYRLMSMLSSAISDKSPAASVVGGFTDRLGLTTVDGKGVRQFDPKFTFSWSLTREHLRRCTNIPTQLTFGGIVRLRADEVHLIDGTQLSANAIAVVAKHLIDIRGAEDSESYSRNSVGASVGFNARSGTPGEVSVQGSSAGSGSVQHQMARLKAAEVSLVVTEQNGTLNLDAATVQATVEAHVRADNVQMTTRQNTSESRQTSVQGTVAPNGASASFSESSASARVTAEQTALSAPNVHVEANHLNMTAAVVSGDESVSVSRFDGRVAEAEISHEDLSNVNKSHSTTVGAGVGSAAHLDLRHRRSRQDGVTRSSIITPSYQGPETQVNRDANRMHEMGPTRSSGFDLRSKPLTETVQAVGDIARRFNTPRPAPKSQTSPVVIADKPLVKTKKPSKPKQSPRNKSQGDIKKKTGTLPKNRTSSPGLFVAEPKGEPRAQLTTEHPIPPSEDQNQQDFGMVIERTSIFNFNAGINAGNERMYVPGRGNKTRVQDLNNKNKFFGDKSPANKVSANAEADDPTGTRGDLLRGSSSLPVVGTVNFAFYKVNGSNAFGFGGESKTESPLYENSWFTIGLDASAEASISPSHLNISAGVCLAETKPVAISSSASCVGPDLVEQKYETTAGLAVGGGYSRGQKKTKSTGILRKTTSRKLKLGLLQLGLDSTTSTHLNHPLCRVDINGLGKPGPK